ncbi:adenylyl-sulfate kinase [Caldalkalibacillus salinus]|uniref:adenylyl-sulfate kinase n=1 Tax=Caldalkalibacillus salinus TaxID=2803787 RepID=UPI0019205114|nr:adenylyl-sulfate kinase [Caldalkalibacillus salinus]
MARGVTVWFTGLSGAGKTTICEALAKKLQNESVPYERLDGDLIRQYLTSDLGYSKQDRMTNIKRVSFVASLLTKHHVIVLASFISPYQEMRDMARDNIGSFVEVYVNCPLKECIRRDVKGLYKKALDGDIKHFTGISDPFEPPINPQLTVETDKETVNESVSKVYEYLKQRGYISA